VRGFRSEWAKAEHGDRIFQEGREHNTGPPTLPSFLLSFRERLVPTMEVISTDGCLT
jgi:hypothetical protein